MLRRVGIKHFAIIFIAVFSLLFFRWNGKSSLIEKIVYSINSAVGSPDAAFQFSFCSAPDDKKRIAQLETDNARLKTELAMIKESLKMFGFERAMESSPLKNPGNITMRINNGTATARINSGITTRINSETATARSATGITERNTIGITARITARITGRIPGAWNSEVTADQGAAAGVKPGFMAITEKGLAGKVTEVATDACVIKLITGDGTSTSAMLPKTTAFGILYGNGTPLLELKNLPGNAALKVGDEVVTSGYGNYPRGISTGKILRIKRPPGLMSPTVIVTPSVDFNNFNYVLLVDLKK